MHRWPLLLLDKTFAIGLALLPMHDTTCILVDARETMCRQHQYLPRGCVVQTVGA
jgi:hypothetical protein